MTEAFHGGHIGQVPFLPVRLTACVCLVGWELRGCVVLSVATVMSCAMVNARYSDTRMGMYFISASAAVTVVLCHEVIYTSHLSRELSLDINLWRW
jgi:hypothetical protein